jgi:PleD family two-component response regulator
MASGLAAAAVQHADRRTAADEATSVDGMTGLLNRRALEQRLDGELLRAERDGEKVSVLMVDLDDFRHYNQTNGHQQGDELLRRLSGVLKTAVRADDLVARFGGEEFVVVFPGAEDSRSGRDLLRGADQAMLEAKREGRNRVLPAEPNYLT